MLPVKYTKMLTWLLASLFYAFQMTLRVLPAIMSVEIMNKFNLDIKAFGMLAGFYYLGYAGGQIPIGLMLDKYQPKYVIAGCIILCISGLGLLAASENVEFAYLARLLIGLGSVAGILGSVKTINDFYPKNETLMLGFTVLIGVIGAIFGGRPVIKLLNLYSMEEVLMQIAVIGLILAALIIVFYNKDVSSQATKNSQISSKLKYIFRKWQIWLAGLCGGLMVGPLEGFADVWGVNYFQQVHLITKENASDASFLIFLGLGIGGPILGYLNQISKNYLRLIASCGGLMIILFMIILNYAPIKYQLILPLTFLIGLFSAYQVIVFSLAGRYAPQDMVGVATSVINMFIMSFGFVFHYIIGYILHNYFTATKTLLGYKAYSMQAYNYAFSVIIIGLIIGSLGFMFLHKIAKSLSKPVASKF